MWKKNPLQKSLRHVCICYLEHPEDAACVPVVVVAEGNVLYTRAPPEETFDMLEEPRLMVISYSVYL